MTTPLAVNGLQKRFGDVVALDGVDIELAPGELLALVGPSGCGKSTLLRSIAGLLAIDAGSIYLDGRLVDDGSSHLPPERRGTGLVFQEHALFPHMSVHDNVRFGVRELDNKATAKRVADMLELVSLSEHATRFPHELSGGERQRVALARALAPEPGLMLFDEPFASLDHNLRVQLRLDVAAALRATGTAAVFVTHDQAEALAIGDRIAVMHRGHIAQIDSPADVFHQPVSQFVAAFMGTASFLPISQNGSGLTSALGPIDTPPSSSEMVAMVRPDDVTFRADTAGQSEVVARQYEGSGWLVTARLADGVDVQVAASHLDPPQVGDRGFVQMVPGHRQVLVPASPSA